MHYKCSARYSSMHIAEQDATIKPRYYSIFIVHSYFEWWLRYKKWTWMGNYLLAYILLIFISQWYIFWGRILLSASWVQFWAHIYFQSNIRAPECLYITFKSNIQAPRSPYITFKSNTRASKSPYITFKSNTVSYTHLTLPTILLV